MLYSWKVWERIDKARLIKWSDFSDEQKSFFEKYKQKPFLNNTNREEKNYIKNEADIKPQIINLSKRKLNKDQINYHKLSLKFCFTPKAT